MEGFRAFRVPLENIPQLIEAAHHRDALRDPYRQIGDVTIRLSYMHGSQQALWVHGDPYLAGAVAVQISRNLEEAARLQEAYMRFHGSEAMGRLNYRAGAEAARYPRLEL